MLEKIVIDFIAKEKMMRKKQFFRYAKKSLACSLAAITMSVSIFGGVVFVHKATEIPRREG